MTRLGARLLAIALVAAPCAPQRARAAGAARPVRFADVGWTDITATTAVAAEVLHSMGVSTEIQVLSIPVTFMGLKTGDVDVFLGNWMPTQANDVKPYLAANAFVDLGVNLAGALYTFAVPSYVHQAGVASAADLARHRARFRGKIHGIEAGNEGNRIVLDMIRQDTYGLSGWTLVESSEQGMLTEVRSAVKQSEWIVFLGWRPHPMNTAIPMAYLRDPLEKWGPGGGASEVHTIASNRFAREERDLVSFFRNLKFTVEMENELMTAILDRKQQPAVAAREWIAAHPGTVAQWLRDVPAARRAAADGDPGPPAGATGRFRVPLGEWISRGVSFLTAHFSAQLRAISGFTSRSITGAVETFAGVPPPVVIPALFVLALVLRRSAKLALSTLAGALLIWNMGYWTATVQTLALVTTASAISVAIGVPLGILAARRPLLFTVLRPVLDTMQTIPTFVYLIPTLMLFGLGIVPGLLSTVIFALPAAIRLTHLGISSVPRELLEAGIAFGARPIQVLAKIEIPHALPSIMEGVSQTLMLSLSMVVISALVGAEGLGTPVVRALNTVDVAQGFEAGLAIVIVAILLDRLVRARPEARARARG
jgi:glycine betaine/proline transport system substrate-binding protein